jgi:hypothetical protein
VSTDIDWPPCRAIPRRVITNARAAPEDANRRSPGARPPNACLGVVKVGWFLRPQTESLSCIQRLNREGPSPERSRKGALLNPSPVIDRR